MDKTRVITLELKQAMEERSSIYTFFSVALLEEIPLAFIENLSESSLVFGNDLDVFIEELSGQSVEQTRTDLAAEYARLFLGMSMHPISLNESAHTSENHLLRQEAYDEVILKYRQGGYEKNEESPLDEDHIAIELDYLARLCKDALDAATKENSALFYELIEKQKSFLDQHVLNWVPALTDTIAERSVSSFYRGVAQSLQQFLETERVFFDKTAL